LEYDALDDTPNQKLEGEFAGGWYCENIEGKL
jgi:hypothetical protein